MLPPHWLVTLALGACLAGPVLADATFTYKLTEAGNAKTGKTISIARFFARIEDAGDAHGYLLYQAGKFFPLYQVDPTARTYTQLTEPVAPFLGPPQQKQPAEAANTGGEQAMTGGKEPPSRPGTEDDSAAGKTPDPKQVTSARAANPSPASQAGSRTSMLPKLKATRKSLKVGGIPCRVILEMDNDEPAVEHCMANAARLKVTEREVITLARTFAMARARQLGWLGTGSRDEEFVSIRSRDLRDNRTLELESVSITPLPAGHLRIPREYKQLEK
jgi:hypothetical protein